jgi:50S ribosomal protein L16 3-hydroxylase
MKKSPLLGGLTPKQFLDEYWHKKPLLIRQAFPGFTPLMTRDALVELATDDEVESRLVTRKGARWSMQNGPFAELPSFDQKGWTLLVQGANLHHDPANALLQEFQFIPQARLDDLMISYASDTGGVGPHFDSYDVFLLQAHGRRRWRISAQKDLSLVEGVPLKILKNFQADEEYVLEPGDMLYLPPHYAHDGTAVGECMTYSIGFRAPSYQELGESFLQFMADSIDLPGRYADPDLAPAKHPAEISKAMVSRIAAELEKVRFTDDDISVFLGEHLSEPKPTVFFSPPARPLTLPRFAETAKKRGLVLSRKSRMLYRGKHVFINGESFSASPADRASLTALADSRKLEPALVSSASQDVIEAFHLWYQDGWLTFA